MHVHKATINGIEVTATFADEAVEEVFKPLLAHLRDLQERKGGRVLVLLAAPPAAGKTTLLNFLERFAPEMGITIQSLGMDGFHRHQAYLLSHTTVRDGREVPMVKVKGAPETFDLEALTERVRLVSTGAACAWPTYDRLLHDPVDDAVRVEGDIVLLEGNYLLLDRDGWRDLKDLADYTISLRADETMLRERLIARRVKTGVDRAASEEFVDFSDMANVRLCLQETLPADLMIECGEDGTYRVLS